MRFARAQRATIALSLALTGAGAAAHAAVPAALPVNVVSVTTPVPRGADAHLLVRTAPHAQCGASVQSQHDPGRTIASLPSQTADGSGLVAFTHRVPALAKPGAYPVTIECQRGGKAAQAHLVVAVR